MVGFGIRLTEDFIEVTVEVDTFACQSMAPSLHVTLILDESEYFRGRSRKFRPLVASGEIRQEFIARFALPDLPQSRIGRIEE
jgi:hypothetical protein